MTQGLSSVQLLSHARRFAMPWTAGRQASLFITNSRSLLKLKSIKSLMPSNHLILCHPLLLLPSIPPSIRVFSNESVLHIGWPKYWSFSFNISPSNEYSGLISFRMDWLDLLAVQGILKSLLQHHSSRASILRRSAFFIVQLSHPYVTTGKTIALTRQTFVSKVMSLLLNMLSRLVIAFLPKSKCLNFMAAVTICSDFGAPQNKVSYCLHCFPIQTSGLNNNKADNHLSSPISPPKHRNTPRLIEEEGAMLVGGWPTIGSCFCLEQERGHLLTLLVFFLFQPSGCLLRKPLEPEGPAGRPA